MPAARARAAVSAAGRVAFWPGMETAQRCRRARRTAHEARDVLGVEHPADEVGGAFRQAAHVIGNGAGRVRVVPAVEPKLGLRRASCQRPLAQALHAGGPGGVPHGGLAGCLAVVRGAQRGKRGARVLDLVRAGKGRAAAGREARFRPGKTNRPRSFPDMPVLAMGEDRGAEPAARASITSSASSCWRPTTTGTPRLMMPGLLGGDLTQRVAEELLVVHVDRRDDREAGLFHHIGRIEPPAEPDLQQGHVGRGFGEGDEGGGGRDLEIGDRVGAIGGKAAVEDVRQRDLLLSDSPARRMRS
jgi:hypothetical protein